MDFGYALYALTELRKEEEPESSVVSPSKEAYRKRLAEALNMNRAQILAFKAKPPTPVDSVFQETFSEIYSSSLVQSTKPRRHIPQKPENILDAPEIVDDYYLNLLDWSSRNVVAIALGNTVYLWDASSGSTSELLTVDDDNGPVTSGSWDSDGQHIAVGLNNAEVQLWDSIVNKQLRTLRGGHRFGVGALSWNKHILHGRNGWFDYHQRCESERPHYSHIQGTPARGLRAEMVFFRATACQWRQRQPPLHLGQMCFVFEFSKPVAA